MFFIKSPKCYLGRFSQIYIVIPDDALLCAYILCLQFLHSDLQVKHCDCKYHLAPEVIKPLRLKFILLINVKITTIFIFAYVLRLVWFAYLRLSQHLWSCRDSQFVPVQAGQSS